MIGSYDRERGWGATNRGRYSNPSLDSLVVEAMGTMDDARRASMFQRASEIAVGDLAMIPIYFQKVSWASKRSVAVEARADETMLAAEMRPR